MRVSKTTMHENFAHNKFRYEKIRGLSSPLKFYNRKKILVEMITNTSNIGSKENVEYFKVLIKDSSGESGKFFEYFFGFFDGKLIIDLIYEIDNLSNLYDNVDYFVKENISELQSYIINKYKVFRYKLSFLEKNLSFDEENQLMQEMVKAHEENLSPSARIGNSIEKKENGNFMGSKKDIVFYERVKEDKENNKGYEFYRKKLFDEDNCKEKDKYYPLYLKSLHVS